MRPIEDYRKAWDDVTKPWESGMIHIDTTEHVGNVCRFTYDNSEPIEIITRLFRICKGTIVQCKWSARSSCSPVSLTNRIRSKRTNLGISSDPESVAAFIAGVMRTLAQSGRIVERIPWEFGVMANADSKDGEASYGFRSRYGVLPPAQQHKDSQ